MRGVSVSGMRGLDQASRTRFHRDPVFLEEARHVVGIVTEQLQRHRRIGVGGAVEHAADQARLEHFEEIHRPQRGFAAGAQFARM